ncbi:hypothetical protein [Aquidulcibacter sp.]|uniref:hypothetical protein n=1 Tax=Aquidulcibacter sp. TaxID=2052990 RepID=UPI0025C07D5A|nr:hypothetical protein [Aquidulcibacter sp.]MCA3062959.1 hypothetical protein [Rhodocyclaceae bacterium]MCA3694233.1 hypothetical protein [Aquidulcibacter sp.]
MIDLDELERLRRDYLNIPFTHSKPIAAQMSHDYPKAVHNTLPALIAELRAYRLAEQNAKSDPTPPMAQKP